MRYDATKIAIGQYASLPRYAVAHGPLFGKRSAPSPMRFQHHAADAPVARGISAQGLSSSSTSRSPASRCANGALPEASCADAAAKS